MPERNAPKHKEGPCLVACSALKAEIQELVNRGDLDADLVFVSKFFHGEYSLLEKNLRDVLKQTISSHSEKPILVYGDLCLGSNNEMKKLAEEHSIAKVDAATCIDCLFGGRGKSKEADPTNRLLLMDPGMIGYYTFLKNEAREAGIDEADFRQLFDGLEGILLLDTLGMAEKNLADIDKLNLGLPVLKTRRIGLRNLKLIILKAVERSSRTSTNEKR